MSAGFEWALVQFEKRRQGSSCLWAGTGTHAQKGQGRVGHTYKFNALRHLSCDSVQCSSIFQSAAGSLQASETRAAGTGIASKWGCWGGCAGSPCQNCCTPGAAKESQSSFVFWPLPSWTVELQLRRSAKLCLFENPYWSLFPPLVVKWGMEHSHLQRALGDTKNWITCCVAENV